MIKAAVIGAGYLGRFHAEKYAKSSQAELAAVVDINLERAQEVAEKNNCQGLTDYTKLPELGVTCVSIVSDTSTHYAVAKWLLENGIDVLVEKPITVTIKEGQELVDIAKATGRILQVGHLERFNPAFLRISEVLTKPLFFEARRIAQFTGRGADVDVVRDLMIHDIDIIAHLVGRPLNRVEAVGVPVLTGSVDIASARLVFEGGCVANVTASRAAFKSERTIRIFQPDVYISLDFGAKRAKLVRKLAEKDDNGLPKIQMEEHVVEEGDALRSEIEAFLICVKERTPPAVRGEDGIRALELVEQITAAVENSIREYDPLLLKAGLFTGSQS
jgi:predicted dehydrogenase